MQNVTLGSSQNLGIVCDFTFQWSKESIKCNFVTVEKIWVLVFVEKKIMGSLQHKVRCNVI